MSVQYKQEGQSISIRCEVISFESYTIRPLQLKLVEHIHKHLLSVKKISTTREKCKLVVESFELTVESIDLRACAQH